MNRLLAMCLLLWAATTGQAVASSAVASQGDLNAFKEVQQSKWEAQKELQLKDIEAVRQQIAAVDKRVDDQLAQLGQSVDRFGIVITLLGIFITVSLFVGGLLGYRNAKSEAKDAAVDAAKTGAQDWFEKHATEVKKQIEALEQKAALVHGQMDQTAQDVVDHADVSKQTISDALSTAQDSIGKTGSATTIDQNKSSEVLARRDRALKNINEDSYSFDDWNTRAHAAYTAGKRDDAAHFWLKAAEIPNSGATNVARVLFNRGITQSQLNQSEAAIASYDEVLRRFGEATELALREQVAKALINKGFTQSQLNQSEAAIASYDDVLRRFGVTTEPALREQVAKALINKGFTQSQLNQSEAAIASYDDVLRRFGEATEPALREQVANALINIGNRQGQLNRSEAAIASYDDVLRRFGEATEPALREQVAKALINKGNRQGQLNQIEAAIASYDDVLRRFGEATEPALREPVAKALVNKGVTQGQLNQSEAAIASYDDALRRFGEATEPALREQVAKALINKGVTQGQLNQSEAAIASYDQVLRRFGEATEPALREQVAKALINKGNRQGQLNQSEAAIASYDEVLRRFGEATEPALREQVANALINKGVTQGQLNQIEAAIATYDEVLRRFGEATEPALREQVANALNGAGFNRLIKAKTQLGPANPTGQALLETALSNLDDAVTRCAQPDGTMLGNRAYVQCLLGHDSTAEGDFVAALRAPVFGGLEIYEATLKDLDRHPLPEDEKMRELVERAWATYQAEVASSLQNL
jgi:tetratricopeptide (TPR) repeat protein